MPTMSSQPPIPASQHGMAMTLPPGCLADDGRLRSSEASLPIGTRLGEFEITGLIGEGGFGIVYMASDHLLGRQVALKEYMPSALAARGAQAQVGVKSDRHAETFEAGRRSFINEARLLAQFDHPALVKVFRFWEANGTAYMVMPYYRGRTLRQALAEMQVPPAQQWLQRILLPLMDALETIHAAQCYHRDIAPDNILLLESGQPVLLDFGAARRVIGDITQALTVILKPGFAPVEQYANGPEMKQGPWTDVYALAAVIYYCATLKTPVPAVSRLMKDTLTPFSDLAGEHYDARFCAAVDRGLAVAVDDRIQSMAEFRAALGIDANPTGMMPSAGAGTAGTTGFGRTASGDFDATIVDPGALKRGRTNLPGPSRNQPPRSGAAEDAMKDAERNSSGRDAAKPWTPNADVQMERLAATGAPARPAESHGNARPWLAVAGLALFLAVGAAGVWYWNQSPAPQEVMESVTATPAASASAPVPSPPLAAPATTPLPPLARPEPPPLALPSTILPAPSATPSTAPDIATSAPPPIAAAPAKVPSLVPSLVPQPGTQDPVPSAGTALFDNSPLPVGRIIDSLHQQRDPDWPVSVRIASDRVRIGKDRLSFQLRSERDGYVYLLMQGTDQSHFYQLFPNGLDGNNRLRGNIEMSLPRSNWEMVAGGPAGLNRFIALVTPSPRNFAAAGLGSSQPFGEFDPQLASKVFASRGAAPFAGEPTGCRLAEPQCATYGAVTFEIEEY